MCGIAGCVVRPGERPDRAALARMAEALAHRGPDAHGIEVEGSVGLVNTRLAVVDTSSAGAQPMRGPDDRWLVTYNGELYDHEELRRLLPAARYRGRSDTETLVHALDAWGSAALPRLNGAFAFAALDTVGRRLLLVRDRFGKKPLYVARDRGTLWFASEMRALFAAGVPRRARPEVLAHTVAQGFPTRACHPVADVERIEPGACAEVDLRTLAISYRRWYAAADAVDPEVVGLGLNLPLEERVGRERKSLLRAVGARHLPAEIVARRKQVGLRSYAKRWTERGARPEFLEEGRLRDVLGVPAEPWRAFVRGLSGNAVIRAVTGEIWCRLMLEGNPAGTVESELWR